MASDAATCRLQLLRGGFSPLPLSGKRPAFDKWSLHWQTNSDEIALWDKVYPHAQNTGALTRLMPTIDIDILDEEAAEAIEQLAKELFEERGFVLVRVGKPPKRAIPLRTNTPFKKRQTSLRTPAGTTDQKIELLCDGQQVVIAGIHPDTHQPYRWHGGELTSIKLDDLPYCSEEDADKFLSMAEDILISRFGFTRIETPSGKTNGHAVGQDEHADWAALVSKIIQGIELHDSLRDMAAAMSATGVPSASSARLLRSLMLSTQAPHDDRWRDRVKEIDGLVRSAGKFAKETEKELEIKPLEFFDAAEFAGIKAPIRRWQTKDRIPMRNVTLLSGDGATGKTTIALQLAVVTAGGNNDWLGAMIEESGKVLFFTAEEEREEVHRRLETIVAHYHTDFAALRGRLELYCAAADDCVIGLPDPKTAQLKLTTLYERIRLAVALHQPKLVIVESSADLYGGSEIDRAQVRQFIRALRKWALEFDCAVLLLSHPSMTGLGSGSGTSGSTAWNNSVRSRLYFLHRKKSKDDDDEAPSDLRELKIMKANYAARGDAVKVVWKNGVFVVEGQKEPENPTNIRKQIEAEKVFLKCLELKKLDYETVCQEEKSKTRYAPKIFSKMPEAKGFSEKDLKLAMQRMFRANPPRLRVVSDGPRWRKQDRIELADDNHKDTTGDPILL